MNGIKYLLDTNIVIGLLQRDLIILNILNDRQIQIGECAYSAITRMELLSFPSITPVTVHRINSATEKNK